MTGDAHAGDLALATRADLPADIKSGDLIVPLIQDCDHAAQS
jgi:hypothetical protein